MQEKIVGIMGAMPEEIEGVIKLLTNKKETTIGRRIYYQGIINNLKTIVVISGWGKVAAATTVSALIHTFHITDLIFTGVAGAINPDLKIGDIVIGKRLVQHDMDVRPLIAQFEIPSLGKVFMKSDPQQISVAVKAVNKLMEGNRLHKAINELKTFHIEKPRLHVGDIASGDQFFSNKQQKLNLFSNLPSILCVEMEGAAVAQVCCEYNLPFTIIRTISDVADKSSHIDFSFFIKEVAGRYSTEIIENMYQIM